MKAISLSAAVALIVGAIAGCSSSDSHQDARRDTGAPTTRSGDREDWNRMQTDPVCGMTVNPKTSIKESYQGGNYYFDTEDCARRFRENPQAYVGANGQNKRNVK